MKRIKNSHYLFNGNSLFFLQPVVVLKILAQRYTVKYFHSKIFMVANKVTRNYFNTFQTSNSNVQTKETDCPSENFQIYPTFISSYFESYSILDIMVVEIATRMLSRKYGREINHLDGD